VRSTVTAAPLPAWLRNTARSSTQHSPPCAATQPVRSLPALARRRRGRMRPACCSLVAALAAGTLLASPPPAAALHPYGHAFSRPGDFTAEQITAIASRFEVFTVEKSTAADVYGRNGSIAATIGTAKRIKAENNSVKVLMYWNAALHYNTYECESEVQPSWTFKAKGHAQPYYNYSVFAFRRWWVQCAVDAFWGNQPWSEDGWIDGFFLDATPKVASGQNGGPGPVRKSSL
jgi:hypothetical protein